MSFVIDIIEDAVDIVTDVIDTVVDVIEDIVDVVVDVIVGIITLIVDVLISIVEAIVDFIASLLGFDDQIVEQFEILNQPLFGATNNNSIKNAILQAIMKGEDIPANILYSQMFGGKKSIRNFTNYIKDGHYFEGFPEVRANALVLDRDEIASTLNTIHGVPTSITQAHLGTLFVIPWIKYWLQENKGYDLDNNTLVYNSVTYQVDINNSTYNIATDDYSIVLLAQGYNITVDDTVFTSLDTTTTTSVASAHTLDIDSTTPLQPATGSNSTSYNSANIVPNYNVPVKATGTHYVIRYVLDNNPTVQKLWVYKVGTGTYPTLDDPSLAFDNPSADVMDILPTIPLRLNNQNFDTAFSASKADSIRGLTKKLGLDADEVITAVMEDVADAGISDYNNKVDHVYLTFGVKVWDTTQIGMQYLYRFCAMMYSNQSVNQATYDASPIADEKPYNNVLISAEDSKVGIRYAYMTFQHYSVAEVNANSALYSIYHTDSTKFDSGNLITSTYYVSSGTTKYAVGYLADNLNEVNAFLAGTLTQEATFVADASGLLQTTTRIPYTGTLLESGGAASADGVLKPDLVYRNDAGALRKIIRIGESVTATQNMKYYQCVTNGLNVYTMKAPIALLRVIDAATSKFKVVKFNIVNQDDLMVPFSYEIVEGLSNVKVSDLFLASAHVSMYVAHYEVIEISFWVKLLAVVLVIVSIVLMYLGWKEGGLTIYKLAVAMVTYYAVKEIILWVAKEYSPELAMILAVVYAVYFGDTKTLTGLLTMFGTAADFIGNIITQENRYDMEALGEREANYAEQYLESMNVLRDLQFDLFRNADGEALDLLSVDTTAEIRPMLPDTYIALNTEKFDFYYEQSNPANTYEQAYDFDVLSA